MMTIWMQQRVYNRVIKLGCDVTIRWIQDDKVFDMCAGSLIICCKPNCAATFSVAFPSILDLSWQYQFFDLALKLQSTQLGIGYFDTIFPSLIPGFPWIFQIFLGFGLGFYIKKQNCWFYQQCLIQNWYILADIENWEPGKAKSFCNRYKHHCLLLEGWWERIMLFPEISKLSLSDVELEPRYVSDKQIMSSWWTAM